MPVCLHYRALLLIGMVCGSMASDCNTDKVRVSWLPEKAQTAVSSLHFNHDHDVMSSNSQADFSGGGWVAAYGKRAWDGQTLVTAAAAFASVLGGPATATAAAAFLQQMIDEQVQAL